MTSSPQPTCRRRCCSERLLLVVFQSPEIRGQVLGSISGALQTHSLRQPLNQFFQLVLAMPEGPTQGQVPEEWSVHFPPPYYSESDSDKAELRSKVANTDKLYVEMGVLTALKFVARFSGLNTALKRRCRKKRKSVCF